MKFFIKTFGCQMNEADSERIRRAFLQQGYQETNQINQAQLVIINSCIVRQSAENRVYGLINNLKKREKPPRIILTGCLAGWALRNKSQGPLRLLRKRVGEEVEIILTEKLADFNLPPQREGGKIAYIPISTGCNHFCSYCIVPFSRGREKSRSPRIILQEVKKAVKEGYFHIILLGQNVNSYGKDLKGKIDFAQLLAAVAATAGVKKVDFISANPGDFSSCLIETIARYPNISRTIHLPVQSGDNKILKKMNRPYTAEQYLALIKKIKRVIPEAEFTTDIIVGFPGETKKQFQNTVRLCRQVGFKRAFIARYSPRPGTAAARMKDDVPPEEKKRRWKILEKLINKK